VTGPAKLSPLERLAKHNGAAGEAFGALRKAVLGTGPLDAKTCELVTLGALATTGEEASFKVHARRFLQLGGGADAMAQAVLVTFGASTTFSDVVAALRWIDEVAAEGAN
jgi:4-carboxymuconolactone decarboxylase